MRLLFGLEGRMRRRTWWLIGFLIAFPSMLLPEVVIALTIGSKYSIYGGERELYATVLPSLIRILVSVPFQWIIMATTVKRRHDRGKSGRDVMVLTAVTYLSFLSIFVPALQAHPKAALVLAYASVPISFWMLILGGFLRGHPGKNQYGPSPRRKPKGRPSGLRRKSPDQSAETTSEGEPT